MPTGRLRTNTTRAPSARARRATVSMAAAFSSVR